MDKDNTVFILGAGASMPYGLPSAQGLRELICKPDAPILKQTRPYHSDRDLRTSIINTANTLSHTFSKSSNESIDIFLSRNPDFSEIGKKAILANIFQSEIDAHFNEDIKNSEHDWYKFFFNWLTREHTEPTSFNLDATGVSIITFNYDRTLEHYLFTSAINSFRKLDKEQIIREISKIKICHVYGQVAPLPWQQKSQSHNFGDALEYIYPKELVENISVIYSERNKAAIQEAIDMIERAKNIFFLGFGYRDENMKLLGFPNILSQDQRVFGTAYGSLKKEIDRIKKRYFLPIKLVGGQLEIENVDCSVLLRKYLD